MMSEYGANMKIDSNLFFVCVFSIFFSLANYKLPKLQITKKNIKKTNI